jgi:hypothetical protein
MKKSIAAPFLAAFPPFVRSSRTKTYGCIAVILLAGCAVLDTHQAKFDQKQLRDLELDLFLDLSGHTTCRPGCEPDHLKPSVPPSRALIG